MLEVLTDNRNRTAPEVRKIFEKAGGNLAANGSVVWMFERKGVFEIEPGEDLGEDRLMEIALEAGAEDLVQVGDRFEIRCEPEHFSDVKAGLERFSVPLAGGEVAYVAKNHNEISEVETARKVLRLLDALDEQDDVQGVYANYQFTDGVIEALEKS